jgi:hypothetical protein
MWYIYSGLFDSAECDRAGERDPPLPFFDGEREALFPFLGGSPLLLLRLREWLGEWLRRDVYFLSGVRLTERDRV